MYMRFLAISEIISKLLVRVQCSSSLPLGTLLWPQKLIWWNSCWRKKKSISMLHKKFRCKNVYSFWTSPKSSQHAKKPTKNTPTQNRGNIRKVLGKTLFNAASQKRKATISRAVIYFSKFPAISLHIQKRTQNSTRQLCLHVYKSISWILKKTKKWNTKDIAQHDSKEKPRKSPFALGSSASKHRFGVSWCHQTPPHTS